MIPPHPVLQTDHVVPQPASFAAPLDEILRVATDILPDCGDRPESVLGPWFEELDRMAPLQRHALRIALAAWCFADIGPEQHALHIWTCGKYAIPDADRLPFRAVHHGPYSVWNLVEGADDRWTLEDRVGLAPQWIPDGPVRLRAWGSVIDQAPAPGATLCARVIPLPEGWVATLPLLLPGRAPDEVLTAWLDARVPEHAERVNYPTIGNLLRRHGHDLVRAVHAWAWRARNLCEASDVRP